MDTQFWLDSWYEGGFKTSFHRRDIHPFILRHFPPQALTGRRILVPLCGKTLDMEYFRQHAQHVIGVELAENAIHQFFEEQRLTYQRYDNRFEAEGLTIICGNFFDISVQNVGKIDMVYDRACLVALPLSMRLQYIKKIHELLPKGGQQFVNTIEYKLSKGEPPFSVSPDELASYYGLTHQIQHLEAVNIPNHGLIRRWGLKYVIEHGFILTRQFSEIIPDYQYGTVTNNSTCNLSRFSLKK